MKKLDPDKHVGPTLAVSSISTTSAILAYYNPLAFFLFGALLAILTLPSWFTYFWNKFIATEDEYYG